MSRRSAKKEEKLAGGADIAVGSPHLTHQWPCRAASTALVGAMRRSPSC